MNRIGTALLVLLLVQCGIAVKLFSFQQESARPQISQQLAPVGSYIVDELQISDLQGDETVLRRQGDNWLLPQLSELPADAAKVQQLISVLTVEDAGWPIARTVGC